jgi:hypothetical protein
MRRYFYSALLLVASFGVAMLLSETAVRIFYPEARDHVTPRGLVDVDSDLGWKLAPGIEVKHHSTAFDVVYTTNSFGFRDKPRQSAKPPGIHRILLLGDSQIFGWGVAEAERFSNLAEERVSGLEVLNLAVPGYGLDQEILTYEEDSGAFDADEVILLVSGVTLLRTRTGNIYMKDKPQFVLDENGSLRLMAIPPRRTSIAIGLRSVLSPLYLPYFLERSLIMLRRANGRASRTEPDSRKRLDELTTKLLLKAVGIASERKQRLTLLLDLPNGSDRDALGFCEQNQITCVTLAVDSKNQDNWLGPHDHHWNPRANLQVTEQFLLQWEKHGGGPDPSTSRP